MRKDEEESLKAKVQKLETEEIVSHRVQEEVYNRCRAVQGAILTFLAIIGGICTFFSDTLRDAGKAALKVIIARIMQ